MKQEWLIDCLIEELVLDVATMNGKATPAEVKMLVKDTNKEVPHNDFSYSNVVGILFYLSEHSWPYTVSVVNCAACYTFCPRHSHELALKGLDLT